MFKNIGNALTAIPGQHLGASGAEVSTTIRHTVISEYAQMMRKVTAEACSLLPLHHWSWWGERPRQNQTSNTEACYGVGDMAEWTTSCCKTFKKLIPNIICFLILVSALAGEIWINHQTGSATSLSIL